MIRALVVGGLLTAAVLFVFSAGWRQPFVAESAWIALGYGIMSALCAGIFLRVHAARHGSHPVTKVFDARIVAAAAAPGLLMTVVLITAGAIPVSGFMVIAAGALGGGVASLLYYPRQFDSDGSVRRQ
ncbi:hypothetical protein ACFFIO_13035 [Citricoccus parietis]|uniref:Uncharacterized protein n=1 Tax=Citricoccus parietis TaxID=592307 RepID=A0ABV6F7D4_9MICC